MTSAERAEIERRLDEDREALERAQEQIQQIDATLQASRRVRRNALSWLAAHGATG